MRGRSLKGHARSLHAPNEPRIIVARPSTTHPLAYRRDLFAICERNREGRYTSLFAPRVFWGICTALCRFVTSRDNMQICYIGERCVTDRKPRGITNVRSWKDRKREEMPHVALVLIYRSREFPWEIKKGNLKVENNRVAHENIIWLFLKLSCVRRFCCSI